MGLFTLYSDKLISGFDTGYLVSYPGANLGLGRLGSCLGR